MLAIDPIITEVVKAEGELTPEQWYGSAQPTTGKNAVTNRFMKGRAPCSTRNLF
jgi:hypothetical protein